MTAVTLALDAPLKLTYKTDLPGGRARLREALLYVCEKCEGAQYFGFAKLNAILWLADFTSFAARARPVTGRAYQRLEHGPAPIEMPSLLAEMEKSGEVRIEASPEDRFDASRPKALVKASLRDFSLDDIGYFDRAIERTWEMTASSVSALAQGVAWKTRATGDLIPYELAYLSDEPINKSTLAGLAKIGRERGWNSL